MHLGNLQWWLILLLNFVGYFVFRFGSLKSGVKSTVVEFIGGTLALASFIMMAIMFGLKETGLLILIFMFPVTFICEALFFKGKSAGIPKERRGEVKTGTTFSEKIDQSLKISDINYSQFPQDEKAQRLVNNLNQNVKASRKMV